MELLPVELIVEILEKVRVIDLAVFSLTSHQMENIITRNIPVTDAYHLFRRTILNLPQLALKIMFLIKYYISSSRSREDVFKAHEYFSDINRGVWKPENWSYADLDIFLESNKISTFVYELLLDYNVESYSKEIKKRITKNIIQPLAIWKDARIKSILSF